MTKMSSALVFLKNLLQTMWVQIRLLIKEQTDQVSLLICKLNQSVVKRKRCSRGYFDYILVGSYNVNKPFPVTYILI